MTALALLLVAPAGAQTPSLASSVVSVGFGTLLIERDGFDDTYRSPRVLSIAAAGAVSVTPRTYLLARLAFAQKRGTEWRYDAVYTHWLLGFGALYSEPLSAGFLLNVQGGFTFNRTEDFVDLSGTEHIKCSVNRPLDQLGLFGGIAIDKSFDESPLGAFVEGLYNYVPYTWENPRTNQSGLFLSAGLRYYFHRPQGE